MKSLDKNKEINDNDIKLNPNIAKVKSKSSTDKKTNKTNPEDNNLSIPRISQIKKQFRLSPESRITENNFLDDNDLYMKIKRINDKNKIKAGNILLSPLKNKKVVFNSNTFEIDDDGLSSFNVKNLSIRKKKSNNYFKIDADKKECIDNDALKNIIITSPRHTNYYDLLDKDILNKKHSILKNKGNNKNKINNRIIMNNINNINNLLLTDKPNYKKSLKLSFNVGNKGGSPRKNIILSNNELISLEKPILTPLIKKSVKEIKLPSNYNNNNLSNKNSNKFNASFLNKNHLNASKNENNQYNEMVDEEKRLKNVQSKLSRKIFNFANNIDDEDFYDMTCLANNSIKNSNSNVSGFSKPRYGISSSNMLKFKVHQYKNSSNKIDQIANQNNNNAISNGNNNSNNNANNNRGSNEINSYFNSVLSANSNSNPHNNNALGRIYEQDSPYKNTPENQSSNNKNIIKLKITNIEKNINNSNVKFDKTNKYDVSNAIIENSSYSPSPDIKIIKSNNFSKIGELKLYNSDINNINSRSLNIEESNRSDLILLQSSIHNTQNENKNGQRENNNIDVNDYKNSEYGTPISIIEKLNTNINNNLRNSIYYSSVNSRNNNNNNNNDINNNNNIKNSVKHSFKNNSNNSNFHIRRQTLLNTILKQSSENFLFDNKNNKDNNDNSNIDHSNNNISYISITNNKNINNLNSLFNSLKNKKDGKEAKKIIKTGASNSNTNSNNNNIHIQSENNNNINNTNSLLINVSDHSYIKEKNKTMNLNKNLKRKNNLSLHYEDQDLEKDGKFVNPVRRNKQISSTKTNTNINQDNHHNLLNNIFRQILKFKNVYDSFDSSSNEDKEYNYQDYSPRFYSLLPKTFLYNYYKKNYTLLLYFIINFYIFSLIKEVNIYLDYNWSNLNYSVVVSICLEFYLIFYFLTKYSLLPFKDKVLGKYNFNVKKIIINNYHTNLFIIIIDFICAFPFLIIMILYYNSLGGIEEKINKVDQLFKIDISNNSVYSTKHTYSKQDILEFKTIVYIMNETNNDLIIDFTYYIKFYYILKYLLIFHFNNWIHYTSILKQTNKNIEIFQKLLLSKNGNIGSAKIKSNKKSSRNKEDHILQLSAGSNTEEYLNFIMFVIIFIKLFCYFFMIANVMTSLWMITIDSTIYSSSKEITNNWLYEYYYNQNISNNKDDYMTIYVEGLYFALTTLLTVGYGDIIPKTSLERILIILYLLFGSLIYSFIFTIVSSILSKNKPKEEEKKRHMCMLRDIDDEFRLPGSLKRNLTITIEEFFSNWHKDKERLLGSLPSNLRTALLIEINYNLLKKIHFLKNNLEHNNSKCLCRIIAENNRKNIHIKNQQSRVNSNKKLLDENCQTENDDNCNEDFNSNNHLKDINNTQSNKQIRKSEMSKKLVSNLSSCFNPNNQNLDNTNLNDNNNNTVINNTINNTINNNPALPNPTSSKFTCTCNNTYFTSAFLIKFCEKLKPAKFEKNSLLLEIGENIDEMYFILTGSITISLGEEYENKKIANIRQGNYYGNILMYTYSRSPYNIRAYQVDNSILILTKKDYTELTKAFTNIMSYFSENAMTQHFLIENKKDLAIEYYEKNLNYVLFDKEYKEFRKDMLNEYIELEFANSKTKIRNNHNRADRSSKSVKNKLSSGEGGNKKKCIKCGYFLTPDNYFNYGNNNYCEKCNCLFNYDRRNGEVYVASNTNRMNQSSNSNNNLNNNSHPRISSKFSQLTKNKRSSSNFNKRKQTNYQYNTNNTNNRENKENSNLPYSENFFNNDSLCLNSNVISQYNYNNNELIDNRMRNGVFRSLGFPNNKLKLNYSNTKEFEENSNENINNNEIQKDANDVKYVNEKNRKIYNTVNLTSTEIFKDKSTNKINNNNKKKFEEKTINNNDLDISPITSIDKFITNNNALNNTYFNTKNQDRNKNNNNVSFITTNRKSNDIIEFLSSNNYNYCNSNNNNNGQNESNSPLSGNINTIFNFSKNSLLYSNQTSQNTLKAGTNTINTNTKREDKIKNNYYLMTKKDNSSKLNIINRSREKNFSTIFEKVINEKQNESKSINYKSKYNKNTIINNYSESNLTDSSNNNNNNNNKIKLNKDIIINIDKLIYNNNNNNDCFYPSNNKKKRQNAKKKDKSKYNNTNNCFLNNESRNKSKYKSDVNSSKRITLLSMDSNNKNKMSVDKNKKKVRKQKKLTNGNEKNTNNTNISINQSDSILSTNNDNNIAIKIMSKKTINSSINEKMKFNSYKKKSNFHQLTFSPKKSNNVNRKSKLLLKTLRLMSVKQYSEDKNSNVGEIANSDGMKNNICSNFEYKTQSLFLNCDDRLDKKHRLMYYFSKSTSKYYKENDISIFDYYYFMYNKKTSTFNNNPNNINTNNAINTINTNNIRNLNVNYHSNFADEVIKRYQNEFFYNYYKNLVSQSNSNSKSNSPSKNNNYISNNNNNYTNINSQNKMILKLKELRSFNNIINEDKLVHNKVNNNSNSPEHSKSNDNSSSKEHNTSNNNRNSISISNSNSNSIGISKERIVTSNNSIFNNLRANFRKFLIENNIHSNNSNINKDNIHVNAKNKSNIKDAKKTINNYNSSNMNQNVIETNDKNNYNKKDFLNNNEFDKLAFINNLSSDYDQSSTIKSIISNFSSNKKETNSIENNSEYGNKLNTNIKNTNIAGGIFKRNSKSTQKYSNKDSKEVIDTKNNDFYNNDNNKENIKFLRNNRNRNSLLMNKDLFVNKINKIINQTKLNSNNEMNLEEFIKKKIEIKKDHQINSNASDNENKDSVFTKKSISVIKKKMEFRKKTRDSKIKNISSSIEKK